MQSNKRFIILLSIIILIIIALTIFYFSRNNGSPSLMLSNNNTSTNTNNNNNNDPSTRDNNQIDKNDNQVKNNTNININNRHNLNLVNDYQEFFSVNALINSYYTEMVENNIKAILNIMDPSYIINNRINESNINNYIETSYEDITYVSKNIYAKGQNGIMYYFVSGEEQQYSFAEELFEKENINYLVIIDTNNVTYSITPLNVTSLFDYAQNYKMLDSKKIEVNESNEYQVSSYSDQTISVYYLNYFRILLYLNTEKAYSMLNAEYKSSFVDYEDFVNHLEELYELLNPNILSYAVKGDDGKRNYSVISTNEQRIDFIENSIMNFSVTIR